MTSLNFIYCPKSGDRVFAEKKCHFIKVVKYNNGCRHVVGGVLLKFFHLVGEPQKNIRKELRQAARVAISSFGGLAWDDRGTIHLVVPVRHGKTALELFKMVYNSQEVYTDRAWDHNTFFLSQAGYAVEVKPFRIGSGVFGLEVRDLDFMSVASEPEWDRSDLGVYNREDGRFEITTRLLSNREVCCNFITKWPPILEEKVEGPKAPAIVD